MKKLHLGCGEEIKKGYVNLDLLPIKGVDVVWDCDKFPYPFKDDEFDEVYTSHTLEHLEDLVAVMTELERICKNKAKIKIVVPHFSAGTTYRDPTHKHRGFSLFTFDYFTDKCFYDLPQFKIRKRRLDFLGEYWIQGKFKFILKGINEVVNSLINLNQKVYERFFCWMLPAYEIHVELEVIKD
jgi:ubiquinone/menaquinone biosynthesis C-methylase UbiE